MKRKTERFDTLEFTKGMAVYAARQPQAHQVARLLLQAELSPAKTPEAAAALGDQMAHRAADFAEAFNLDPDATATALQMAYWQVMPEDLPPSGKGLIG